MCVISWISHKSHVRLQCFEIVLPQIASNLHLPSLFCHGYSHITQKAVISGTHNFMPTTVCDASLWSSCETAPGSRTCGD